MSVDIYSLKRYEYNKLNFDLLKFRTSVSTHFNINIKDLRWYHFKSYCEEVLNYIFDSFGFNSKLKDTVAGCLIYEDGQVLIVHNETMDVTGRIYFTILHEIVHSILHLNEIDSDVSFSDLLHPDEKLMDSEMIIIEAEADAGAGMLQICDESLLELFQKGSPTFNSLAREYSASYSAVEVRLKQFLFYNFDLGKSFIEKIVNEYRYKDNSFMRFIVIHWNNFTRKVHKINRNTFIAYCEELDLSQYKEYEAIIKYYI